MIHSKSREEHEQHLSIVHQTLRQEKLYAKLSKCKFSLEMVAFVRHIISNCISVSPSKVEVVLKYERLKSVTEVRNFLGLTRY